VQKLASENDRTCLSTTAYLAYTISKNTNDGRPDRRPGSNYARGMTSPLTPLPHKVLGETLPTTPLDTNTRAKLSCRKEPRQRPCLLLLQRRRHSTTPSNQIPARKPNYEAQNTVGSGAVLYILIYLDRTGGHAVDHHARLEVPAREKPARPGAVVGHKNNTNARGYISGPSGSYIHIPFPGGGINALQSVQNKPNKRNKRNAAPTTRRRASRTFDSWLGAATPVALVHPLPAARGVLGVRAGALVPEVVPAHGARHVHAPRAPLDRDAAVGAVLRVL